MDLIDMNLPGAAAAAAAAGAAPAGAAATAGPDAWSFDEPSSINYWVKEPQ